MTAPDDVIDALNAALKYERTIQACLMGYHEYWERWRFHRLAWWFKKFAKKAGKRVDCLEDRLNELDSIPGHDAYEFKVVVVENPGDINDVWDYFITMGTEARQVYEDGRDACKAAGDSVSASILKRGKCGVEKLLCRVEAKQRKITLVGPVEYLAHHMHPES